MNLESQKLLKELVNYSDEIVIGKNKQIIITIAAILSGGHILIEDVPGMGKTTLAHTISSLFGLEYNRIQFTSDLMPADILGFKYLDQESGKFTFSKGPIFTNILLADEINRASPKSQSAFLQAMEEREISIEGEDFKLNENFVVIATQNPEDQVGTHPLPESQVDRFSVSFSMGGNTREDERKILLNEVRSTAKKITALLNNDQFNSIKKEINQCQVSDNCFEFILDILTTVREKLGHHISIRAGHDIKKLSRAKAIVDGRDFITPDDILFFAPFVLGHRVSSGEDIELGINKIKSILSQIEAPIRN